MDILLQTNDENKRLEFRNPEKFSDSSGYRVNLFVNSRGLSVEWPFYFEEYPFDEFIKSLVKMEKTLKGSSQLKPLFEDYFIEFELNKTGQLFVRGELIEYTDTLQSIKFEFKTDQTCLKHFITDLKKLQAM